MHRQVASASAIVIPVNDILMNIELGPAVALVLYALARKDLGPTLVMLFGKLSKDCIAATTAVMPWATGGTFGNLDDGLIVDDLVDRQRLGRVVSHWGRPPACRLTRRPGPPGPAAGVTADQDG